jgi:acetyltransferase-like isoleucine patch superfamily enzyme
MPTTWVKPLIEHMKETKWGWRVWYPENLELGERVDIGAFTLILAHNGVVIEDDVQIGSHCAILSKSTIDGKDGAVFIGRGAKIGTHSTIMPGVIIGAEAVVGAHSFVTKMVQPRSTVFGVPAEQKDNRRGR